MLSVLFYLAAALAVPEAQKDTLAPVTVVADRGVVVSRKDIVNVGGSDDISGAISRLSSLTLQDNGSAAGLKSVSLRGLGSAGTMIYIDGVRANNIQNGQPDLALFDQMGFSTMSVDYAQNSLSFITAAPTFEPGRPFNGSVRLSGGSWGTFNPSVRMAVDLGRDWSAAANASYYSTDGDFLYSEGLHRENNDICQSWVGGDVFKRFRGGRLHLKGSFRDSDRGTPGSTEYPDATSRQHDRSSYLQANFRNRFSDLYELNLTAKIGDDDLRYEYSYGKYVYDQNELQLNLSNVFHIYDRLSASAAAGCIHDVLDSSCDGTEYYKAHRTSLHGSGALALRMERLSVNMALLANAYFDGGNAAQLSEDRNRRSFEPSIDFNLRLTERLSLLGFARRAFRMPTFNDLYYPNMGNTSLLPERALLTDLGIEYAGSSGELDLSAKVDVFHYRLDNKIIYAPDPADETGWTWLPFNVGKVLDNGADVSLEAKKSAGDFRWDVSLKYSYQYAVDRTPSSETFGKQIPYVARHTLSSAAVAEFRNWKADVRYSFRGDRYDSYGPQDGWSTVDLLVSKKIGIRNCGLTLFAKASDILDAEYEIIRYYPMPGRSITLGLELCF